MDGHTCYKTQRGSREKFLFEHFPPRLDYSVIRSFDLVGRDARILIVGRLLGCLGIGKPGLEDL